MKARVQIKSTKLDLVWATTLEESRDALSFDTFTDKLLQTSRKDKVVLNESRF